jgi:hypothetical protein
MSKVALLLLIFAAACATSDPRAEAEQRVQPPKLGPVRAALPGAAAATFAATDALAWLERGPSATDDVCTFEPGNTKAIFAKQWWEVSCHWNTTRYYGFDGDFAARTQAVNDALIAAGWSDPRDLGLALTYYRDLHGRPEGKRKYDASNLPSVAYDRYVDNQPWTMRLSWTEVGQVPEEFERPLPKVDHLYREAAEVDRVQVHRDLTSRHQFVLVVSVGTRYLADTVQ